MNFKKYTPTSGRKQLWSSGGGTQSTAIAVLIAQGKLPKPDIAVMSDTGREHTPVFEYLERYVKPMLESVGVEVHVVQKSDFIDFDLCSGKDGDTVLPPFFSRWGKSEHEELARQPSYCSDKWKTTVVRRFVNSKFPKGTKFETWMGMSTDELRRVKPTIDKWQKRYPLVEMRLSRDDCIALVVKHGLPLPPRSACWMCPNRHDTEWSDLKENHPEDFEKAIAFEQDELQKDFPWLYLHKSGKPIGEVIFTDGTHDLFANFCDGGCFT